MAVNMDLVVFAQTGHVLAGALRNQTGGAGPTVEELAGKGLWLRDPTDGILQLVVAADYLSIVSTPLREDLLLTPRYFQVVDNLPEPKSENTAGTPVDLDGTDITITLSAAAPSDIDAWVVVSNSNITVVQKVGIAEAASSGTEALPLQTGTYQVLVLVPDYRALVEEVTVV